MIVCLIKIKLSRNSRQFERQPNRIDKFLLADDLDVLKNAGKISHEIACDKALTEFEKYRAKQDKLYKSDFDILLENMQKNTGGNDEGNW